MSFLVYSLHCVKTGCLLYIGRSRRPKTRMQRFAKRTGKEVKIGALRRFNSFERACAEELAAIERHKPPFNLRLVSSPGTQGMKLTIEQRAKISLANATRILSDESKAKIAASLRGRKLPDEHREHIRKGMRRKWNKRKELQ